MLISALYAYRYGARLRGPKSNGVNDGRTAVLYHFSTYDEVGDATISHNTQEPAKTPQPWWPSRPPLQRHGVDGLARSNVRATRPW